MQLSGLQIPEAPVTFEFSTDDENAQILTRIEKEGESYAGRVKDVIGFAKWVEPNLPDLSIEVRATPLINFRGSVNGHKFRITLAQAFGSFDIDGSVETTLELVGDRIKVGRELLKHWETIVKHLPEGFIIYGPDCTGPASEHFKSRQKVLEWMGFGPVEDDSSRFGIIRDRKVQPLTTAEYKKLTNNADVGELFNQRFLVETITWPGSLGGNYVRCKSRF